MTCRLLSRARLAVAAPVLALACGSALAGCGQSSDTTSAGAAGTAPATTAPATTSTPTSATTTTTSTTGSAPAGSSGPLTVSPTTGSPHSVIHFVFAAPAAMVDHSTDQVSATLSVVGPQKAGCIGLRHQPVTSVQAGLQTAVSLGPTQLGGDWCPGSYTARVLVLARPKCGEGMMCPQFIRVVATLGPATFKISG